MAFTSHRGIQRMVKLVWLIRQMSIIMSSIQMSGDRGLAQSFVASDLQHEIESVYILRPEKSVADARIDEYIKPYESSWFWSIVLRD